MYKFLSKNFPTNPGVYIYKNNKGDIIYIGKAKNLKKEFHNILIINILIHQKLKF